MFQTVNKYDKLHNRSRRFNNIFNKWQKKEKELVDVTCTKDIATSKEKAT